uniref:Uncharacterized protein n=1 Tax=Peronospora matthiolae TaxID=2874970 RepID=A0AAV1T6P9_9STRA
MGQALAVVDVSPAHERSEATEDKILATPVGLTERLAKLESSQRVCDEDERMLGAVESGMFASALDANICGRPMTIDALGSPEQKPAYPARAPAPNDSVPMFSSLAPPRGQAPPQQRVPAQAAATAVGAHQQARGVDYISKPTSSQ